METQTIYHGSTKIIENPAFGFGKKNNDYGQGFYCTKELELAKEWAAQKRTTGIVNKYELSTQSLNILDLEGEEFNILNWIALLVKNRSFNVEGTVASIGKEYLIDNFLPDLTGVDVISGYRADDSYFSFANGFLHNTISVGELQKAMILGDLGIQKVLVSEKAFSSIKFTGYEDVPVEKYYASFKRRDLKAREEYSKTLKSNGTVEGLYLIDIIRQEVKADDPRIQRTLYK